MTLGDFLWGLLSLYFLFFYFAILFGVLDDLFKDRDVSGMGKVTWILLLLFLPVIGLIAYGIRRGEGMADRSLARAAARTPMQRAYVRDAVGTPDEPTAQIARAHELLLAGAVTESEFDTMKAKALAS